MIRLVAEDERDRDRAEAAAQLRHLAGQVESGQVTGYLALFSFGPEAVGDGATVGQLNHGWTSPEALWAMQTIITDWVRPDQAGDPLEWDDEDEP